MTSYVVVRRAAIHHVYNVWIALGPTDMVAVFFCKSTLWDIPQSNLCWKFAPIKSREYCHIEETTTFWHVKK